MTGGLKKKKIVKPQNIVTYIVLVIGMLIVLLPMYVTIITAFKTHEESAKSFFQCQRLYISGIL